MAIRSLPPQTPGRRGMTTQDTSMLTRRKPLKSLLKPQKSRAGRNNRGVITVRRRGGGVRRRQRQVDFKLASGTEATVIGIEYDPGRSARIALLEKTSGGHAYVLAGVRMAPGDTVSSGEEAAIKPGNRLPLANIPLGSTIYNIEVTPGRGGQLVRSAGARAVLNSREESRAYVRLPSGEVRLIHTSCYATLGSVGNEQHQNIKIGSAGRNRRLGKRPKVRGKAMNPADHGMGGGEGQSSPGRHPVTPWGKKAIGPKTRRRKDTDKFIIRSRHVAKRK